MENQPASKPLIYTVTGPEKQKALVNKIKSNLPKFLFGILALIILIELIFGVRTLYNSSFPPVPKIQPLGSGKIILEVPKNVYKTGEEFPLEVRIVTAGKSTDSTDLVLHYNPKQVQMIASQLKMGTIYSDYPIADDDSQTGIIRISGITPPGEEGFNGIGTFATIPFKTLSEGDASFSVEFTKDSTTDSNLVESGAPKDILTEIKNQDITISNSQTTQNVKSKNVEVCKGYLQYCQDSKGMAGSQYCTSGILKEGACVFDPVLSTSCGSCKIK